MWGTCVFVVRVALQSWSITKKPGVSGRFSLVLCWAACGCMLPHSEPEEQARGLRVQRVRVRRAGKYVSYLAMGERERGTARRVGRWCGRSAVGRGTTGRCSRDSWRGRSAVGRWATGRCSRGSWRSRSAVGRRTKSRCSRGLWRGRSAVGVRPVQLRLGMGATRVQEAEGRDEHGDAGESASGRRTMQPGVELHRNATCGALRPSRARGSSRDGARTSRARAARCRCRQPDRRCHSSRA